MQVTVRKLAAEALGTGLLLAAIVGSGIMAERLAQGNVALALLCNTLATGSMLAVLIAILGPISGAQLNPAVTMVMALRREIAPRLALLYAAAQISGAVLGTLLAHAMFDERLFQVSATARSGFPLCLAEGVATFGLVLTLLGTLQVRPAAMPATIGLYIVSAYWFTASTSFANPAVTIARALTDSFAGIAPADAPWFIVAQLGGALLAASLAPSLWPEAVEQAR